jgi:hypothetical protein
MSGIDGAIPTASESAGDKSGSTRGAIPVRRVAERRKARESVQEDSDALVTIAEMVTGAPASRPAEPTDE